MIPKSSTWRDFVLVAGCASIVVFILFQLTSRKRSPMVLEDKTKTSLSPGQDRKKGLLASLAAVLVASLALTSTFNVKGPAMHLVGDNIVSSDLLAQLEGLRTDWRIPGVSIAVVKLEDDGNWRKQIVGLGQMNANGRKVTDETLFSLGSNSKLFTSISVGIALRRAGLTWTTPVRSVLPQLRFKDPVADEKTTFIELLSHQTGVPRHDLAYSANATIEETMELLAHLRPSAPFNTRWQYNNIAYSSAAQVPRQLFDESFEDFVAENIWKPLGMTRSHYDVSIAKATNHLSSGFGRRVAPGLKAKLQDVEACERDVRERGGMLSDQCRGEQQDLGWSIKHWRGIAGAGGVITCAKDMTIWLQTLLLEGKHPETGLSIIPSSIIQDVRKSLIATKPKEAELDMEPEMSVPYYGMAQWIYTYRGHEIVEHVGAIIGHKSTVIRVPDSMIGIAIMNNDEQLGGKYYETIKLMILDEMLGLEPIDWRERKLTKLLNGSKPSPSVKRPTRPRAPDGGFDSIVGTYHNVAYGDLVLEPASIATDPRHEMTTPPTFHAAIDKLWVNNLLFSHFDGGAFNVTAKLNLPESEAVLWDILAGIEARSGEGGVGLQGIWGSGANVEGGDMDRHGVRDGAEVFFERK